MALLAIVFFGLMIMSSAEAGSVLINIEQSVDMNVRGANKIAEFNNSAETETGGQVPTNGTVPGGTPDPTKCVYQNEVFAIGESVTSFPADCSQLQCEADSQGKPIITLGKSTCCFYQEKTFTIGDTIVNLPGSCSELTCDVNSVGEPTIALVNKTDCNNVCHVQNLEYALGDTISTFPSDCLDLKCELAGKGELFLSSHKVTDCLKYKTTCVYQGQDYGIGEVVASFPAYCSQLVCEADSEGNAKLSQKEFTCGSNCAYQGRTYPIGQSITTFIEGCFELKCASNNDNKPTIVLNFQTCSQCIYQGGLHAVGTVVETFLEYNVMLKCVESNSDVIVKPVPVPLCMRAGKSYNNGDVMDDTNCLKLICSNGKWLRPEDIWSFDKCGGCWTGIEDIRQFDGNYLDSLSTSECSYDFVRANGSSIFSGQVKSVNGRNNFSKFTFTQNVNEAFYCYMTIYGTVACSFGRVPDEPTLIDSHETLAYSLNEFICFHFQDGTVVAISSRGIYPNIFMRKFQSGLEGLCGNFNGNPNDDSIILSDFASWVTPGTTCQAASRK